MKKKTLMKIMMAMLAARMFLAGFLLPLCTTIDAYAAEGQNLVIEVVEEIPADRMVKHKNGMVEPMAGSSGSADGAVEIEDSEVPLAAGPAERAFPVIPVIYLGAAVIAFAGYELIGHRRRNALFKIRRDGYREEARRQREKEAAR